jgi:hypothetical protein
MVDLIVDMDYGKCSYTRIFLVYAETSRSDSKGFQKIPKVYDYDYDITFFLLTNVTKKNKKNTTTPPQPRNTSMPNSSKSFQRSKSLFKSPMVWSLMSRNRKKKNAAVLWDAPENHSRTKNHVESHDPKTERC